MSRETVNYELSTFNEEADVVRDVACDVLDDACVESGVRASQQADHRVVSRVAFSVRLADVLVWT